MANGNVCKLPKLNFFNNKERKIVSRQDCCASTNTTSSKYFPKADGGIAEFSYKSLHAAQKRKLGNTWRFDMSTTGSTRRNGRRRSRSRRIIMTKCTSIHICKIVSIDKPHLLHLNYNIIYQLIIIKFIHDIIFIIITIS